MLQNMGKSWRTTSFSRQEKYDLGKDSFSSTRKTWSIWQKLYRSGLKTTRWMFLSSRIKAQTSIQWRICGWTWKRLFTPQSQCLLTGLEQFCKEQCSQIAVCRWASLTETYSHKLSPVIVAQGASTKYWLEGGKYLCNHLFYVMYF